MIHHINTTSYIKPSSLLSPSVPDPPNPHNTLKRKREEETNIAQRNVKRRIDQSTTSSNKKKKRFTITIKRPSNSNDKRSTSCSSSDIEIIASKPHTNASSHPIQTTSNFIDVLPALPSTTPPAKPPVPSTDFEQKEKQSDINGNTLRNGYEQWEDKEQKSIGIEGNQMRIKSKTRSKTVAKKKKKKKKEMNESDQRLCYGAVMEHNYKKYDLINDLNWNTVNKKIISKEVIKKQRYQYKLDSLSSTESLHSMTTQTQTQTQTQSMHSLQMKYKSMKKKYKEMKECALKLYKEVVEGEQPRWHLIEFIDTEHRVTRDAELAELRTNVSSLYPKGSFEVCAVDKWVGRADIEESVLNFVKLNGEYRIKPYLLLSSQIVPVNAVISKYLIEDHSRISALNGQFGVKATMAIPKGTCIGQYFGAEILQKAFGKVFDGTGEEYDHNIYAFDQKIDPKELKKVKEKQRKIAMERNQYNNNNNTESFANLAVKVFIIDPFIGNWKNDELLLRFVNDCRGDIDCSKPTKKDQKYYNVEYVGMKVNGWPQTYLIAKKDIKKDEELMTYYGTDFSNAIAMKMEEEQKRKNRKERIHRDILQQIRL